MLNPKLELEKIQPIQLEAIEKKSDKLPENIRASIQLFNKSLEDVKCGNEDMAIIALKKAISINPSFYEAMNLLGISYLIDGKEDKAREAFSQVIQADDSSIKAMGYLEKMDGAGESNEANVGSHQKRSEKAKNKKNIKSSSNSISESSSDRDKSRNGKGLFAAWLARGLKSENNNIYGLKYIAGILIGVFMVGLIWYMVPTNKSLFTFEKDENIIKNPELEEEIEKLNQRIIKLEDDITARKEENLKLMDNFQVYKDWIDRLNKADSEYSAGNYSQGADLLLNTQGMTIPNDLTGRYDELWDKIRIKAAEQLYLEATSIYNGNRDKSSEVYKQAFNKYETAIAFLEDDKVAYHPALYYQAGKAAARSDELERAVELFEAVRKEFPNSSYSSYAGNRLNEIQSGREISGN
ncbi:MAG: tetratricopeptide repeat protein [Ruminiclostridium sp.]|nr:tetratricopeptide repeat protein [Ruminiclostridium sp.]